MRFRGAEGVAAHARCNAVSFVIYNKQEVVGAVVGEWSIEHDFGPCASCQLNGATEYNFVGGHGHPVEIVVELCLARVYEVHVVVAGLSCAYIKEGYAGNSARTVNL